MSDMNAVPNDVLGLITKTLSSTEIGNIQRTCKDLNNKIKNSQGLSGQKALKEADEKKIMRELQHQTSELEACTKVFKKFSAMSGSAKKTLMLLGDHNPTYAKSLLMYIKTDSLDIPINSIQKAVRANPNAFDKQFVAAAQKFKDAKDALKKAMLS